MSTDHKPNNEGEKARIEAVGGYVSDNRVQGSLALSRAFGDFSLKVPPQKDTKDKQYS